MSKLYILLSLLIVSLTSTVYSQENIIGTKSLQIPFCGGEKLEYTASYRIGFINIDLARVSFSLEEDCLDNQDSYHLQAIGEINSGYAWFFDMYDVYDVWLDKHTLRPIYFKSDISEGNYKYKSNYVYDWDSLKVSTVERRKTWTEDRSRTYDLTPTSYDPVSIFYNLRTKNVDSMTVCKADTLQLVFANKIRKVAFRYMGKEIRRVPRLGKVETLKFRCQLADDSGVSFKDGNEFSIWFSNDGNYIPVYIETPIRVGSVRVRLSYFEGLKNHTNLKFKR